METIQHENITFLPKFPRSEPLMQDSTAMKDFKECDRKYFYRQVIGYVPRQEKFARVFAFGNARHTFRQILENSKGDLKLAMQAAYATKFPISDPTDKFNYLDKTRLTQMMAVDYTNWEKEKEQGRIKVLYVEQVVNVQLPDGSIVAGRIDQGIELSGQIWDRDWKTTSKQKAYFASEKDPDDQATRYIYILSKLSGRLIGGVLFDVIYNTGAKTPIVNEHFTHTVSKTPKQLALWEKEQVHINRQLKLNREMDIWPMKEGRKCTFCPYNSLCRQNNEAAITAKLQSEYKHSPWDFTKVGEEEAA